MNTILADAVQTLDTIAPATLRGQALLRLAPTADRSAVSVLKFIVTAAQRTADGAQQLRVTCGDFHLLAWLPPGCPAVQAGVRYCIEREPGSCPFSTPFSAIYPDIPHTTYH